MLMRLLIGASAVASIGGGEASAQALAPGLRAGPVDEISAGPAEGTAGSCETAPMAFARANDVRASPTPDWCVAANLGAISAAPAWTAEFEFPLGVRVAPSDATTCGPAPCAPSRAVGSLAVSSVTPLGTIKESGTLAFAGPTQLAATFGQAGAGLPTQSATLDLLTGPYGGQVLRVTAWPGLRSTEAGDVSAVPQSLTLRFWGRQGGSALRMLERCDVRHQTRLLLRSAGAAQPDAAMVDDYALTGCAGRTTAGPLSDLSALPSALTPFFATQARAKRPATDALGWLRTVLVPELAAGTEVVAMLRTPGKPTRTARASYGAAGDATLQLRPRAVITKASRLSITSTVSGGEAVRERFRFLLASGVLRARHLPQSPSSNAQTAPSSSRPRFDQ